MNTLYLVTGPAGVGKSTVSRILAKKKEKSVLIEGDEIYSQVIGSYKSAWLDGNHLDVFWEVCINIIKIYMNHGYDVIFNYIIDFNTLNMLIKELGEYNKKFICLLVKEDTLLKRDSERPDDCQMKERCLILLNEFINDNYDDKNILYTDNLTTNETVEEIDKNSKYFI